ncbi:aspartate/glutamate racemase family protein [Clostridium ragsdalei]|uniref:aspartate/glutamate racemase family protein n=1 Tax=Clostridium ragsdalei TaxID=217158 RepID=UPI0023B93D59|nr:amino acid racemase [Clostridium ragsdalei]
MNLKNSVNIPLVSIIEATCDEVKRRNISKVGLLETIFTMNGEFFKKPFTKNHIEVITPTDEEREFVNQKISQELELGIVKEETLLAFLKIIQRMKVENGIQAIILGCTEFPLLVKGVKTPVDCLDTMQIHIETLVNMIIDN